MLYPFTLVIRPTFELLAIISNVQRAKVPGNESSTLWNFRSRERKFFRTEVPATYQITAVCYGSDYTDEHPRMRYALYGRKSVYCTNIIRTKGTKMLLYVQNSAV